MEQRGLAFAMWLENPQHINKFSLDLPETNSIW